jgi:hypothetical protein
LTDRRRRGLAEHITGTAAVGIQAGPATMKMACVTEVKGNPMTHNTSHAGT